MKNDLSLHNITGRKLIADSSYKRPSDWLVLPEVLEGDNKFIGLYPVFEYGSTLSTIFYTNGGASYIVDWGDNNTNTYSSGSTASHTYDYSSISNSTLCSRGYKQVIITVSPQSGSFSSINISNSGNKKNWLDINLVGSDITSISNLAGCLLLERFNYIGTTKVTNFSYMFQGCYSLKTVPALNTSLGTSFNSMFSSCYSLQTIPALNVSLGTNFSFMFQSCYSLQTIPVLNTTLGTNFSCMFQSCYSLQIISLIDTSKGTNFGSMFSYCSSLQTIPSLNTSIGTDFSYMFENCASLQTVPALNTSLGTSFSSLFSYCSLLQKAALSGTSKSISYSNCQLSKQALVDIFNGLASGVTGQTITISGNPGTSSLTTDDRLIATNKGWTISG